MRFEAFIKKRKVEHQTNIGGQFQSLGAATWNAQEPATVSRHGLTKISIPKDHRLHGGMHTCIEMIVAEGRSECSQ